MKYLRLILCSLLFLNSLPLWAGSGQGQAKFNLELPKGWAKSELMAPTDTLGLRIYSYLVTEPEQKVLQWRKQHMSQCRLPAVDGEEDDWHCLSVDTMYSLLRRTEGFIWVRSERIPYAPANIPDQHHGFAGLEIDAEVLSHSESAFESVTLLHSRRSLYALQNDLRRRHVREGAQLLLAEQNPGGFIQQWQAQQGRVTYTAQKDEQGDVLLLKVRGTNL